jgi:hypothetical protein
MLNALAKVTLCCQPKHATGFNADILVSLHGVAPIYHLGGGVAGDANRG